MPGLCHRCQKPVYAAEEKLALGGKWHMECFTCGWFPIMLHANACSSNSQIQTKPKLIELPLLAICNQTLDSSTLAEHRELNEIYCKKCYRKFFGIKGYGYGPNGPALITVDPGLENEQFLNLTQSQENFLRRIPNPPPHRLGHTFLNSGNNIHPPHYSRQVSYRQSTGTRFSAPGASHQTCAKTTITNTQYEECGVASEISEFPLNNTESQTTIEREPREVYTEQIVGYKSVSAATAQPYSSSYQGPRPFYKTTKNNSNVSVASNTSTAIEDIVENELESTSGIRNSSHAKSHSALLKSRVDSNGSLTRVKTNRRHSAPSYTTDYHEVRASSRSSQRNKSFGRTSYGNELPSDVEQEFGIPTQSPHNKSVGSNSQLNQSQVNHTMSSGEDECDPLFYCGRNCSGPSAPRYPPRPVSADMRRVPLQRSAGCSRSPRGVGERCLRCGEQIISLHSLPL